MISAVRQVAMKDRFGREADSLYLEAKRATFKTNAEIPYWFIVLTILLGWNEFLLILRNPLLTFTLLIAAAGTTLYLTEVGYIIFYTNTGGPIMQIAKATTQESLKQFHNQLKERGLDPALLEQKVRSLIQGREQEIKKRE